VTGAGAKRRLFFALWPELRLRQRLLDAAAPLLLQSCAQQTHAELLAVSDLHITLAFLGAVPESVLPVLRQQAAAINASGFMLRLDRFEYWGAAQVLCAVADEVPGAAQQLLQKLQAVTAAAIVAAAVAPGAEPQPFRPHMTLARHIVLPHAMRRSLPALALNVAASEFSLAESRRQCDGRRYHVLDSWPLS